MKLESKAKLCCVALALLISAGAAHASDATKALGHEKWHPWFEVGGYGSNEEARGEAVMFAPLWQSSTALLFTDIRGKLFDAGEFEGNAALGLRAMQPSGWNLGAWVGWDVRHTEFENTFNQVAFGFEAIRPDFDVRLNGYIPTDNDELATRADAFAALLAGNSIFVKQTTDIIREYALYGVDAEIGFRVPLKFWDADAGPGPSRGVPRHELRLYGGGFWFDQDDFESEVAGPKARLEWRINDVIRPILGSRLTIEAEYQYDDIRDHQFEFGARFRIPFGGGGRDARNATLARLTGQERRMMDGLERDVDVIVERQTDTTETLEGAIDNETNVRFDRVAYVDDGGNLQATLTATGPNSLVLLTGGTLAGNAMTLADQTVQGGASTIFIRGALSGAVVPFTAPGTKPTVQAVGGLDVLIIGGDNVHIAGLGIDALNGPNNDGIDGDDFLTNIVLQQNMITNTGKNGIDFDFDNTNIRVFNNMITNTGDDGIDFEGFNSDIRVFNNIITNPGDDGIDFEAFNNDITITGNTINIADGGNDRDGVDLEDFNRNVTIANNIIMVGSNILDGDGIDIFEGNRNIIITDNVITVGSNNFDGDGMDFVVGNRNITITNNIITVGSNNDDGDGIEFFESNRGITIANNVIRTGDNEATADGIDLVFDNTGVSITGNTITPGNLGDGINIDELNQVAINDNLFNGLGFDAVIDFDFVGNVANGSGNSVAPGTIVNALCEVGGAGAFVGMLEIDGMVFVNGVPCT